MNTSQQLQDIFKKGSKTFYHSSIFFPEKIRNDVTALYAFVRVADDFVDSIPAQSEKFFAFKNGYYDHLKGQPTENIIIIEFVALQQRMEFEQTWIDAFLHSMEMDLNISSYENLNDLDEYLFGSAEVVGLMMSRIMGLPKESYAAARMLGKAFQYINFIRDIQEDIKLKRLYIPTQELQKFGLSDLHKDTALQHIERFEACIRAQIAIFETWCDQAKKGFHYIPRRFRIPIQTATDMYRYTADIIRKNPLIIYEKKVKPAKWTILKRALHHLLFR